MKNKKQKGKKSAFFLYAGLFLCIGIALFAAVKAFYSDTVEKNANYAAYMHLLTPHECEEWENRKTRKDEVFLQINTKVPVDANTREAALQLVNPLYCGYDLEIEIQLCEKEEGLYASQKISPGTVLGTVFLTKELPPGEHKATVNYTFYNRFGQTKGTKQIEITLVVQAEGKRTK